jgi:hypothetical protein
LFEIHKEEFIVSNTVEGKATYTVYLGVGAVRNNELTLLNVHRGIVAEREEKDAANAAQQPRRDAALARLASMQPGGTTLNADGTRFKGEERRTTLSYYHTLVIAGIGDSAARALVESASVDGLGTSEVTIGQEVDGQTVALYPTDTPRTANDVAILPATEAEY